MTRERTAAPILEVLISISIIALAGIMTLSAFLSARYTQMMSKDKVMSMYKAQNVIETIKITEDTSDITIYYDENWTECDENRAQFRLLTRGRTEDGFYSGIISCERTEEYPFIGGKELCRVEFGNSMGGI